MKIVNDLDVTFNLNVGTYKPYKKSQQRNEVYPFRFKPSSINHKADPKIKSSNIIFVIIIKRDISRGCTIFNLIKKTLQMWKTKGSKKRKRSIVWFNLLYIKTMKTTIGQYFFHLINKLFPLEHEFHKIFNRNTF